MKYLSDYMDEEQTKLFDEKGVFFAFSKKQFEDGCKKVGATANNKVCELGNGIYCLSKNADYVTQEVENIYNKAIKQDLDDNGIENIISRELGNYETQLSGDTSRTVEALKDYNISEEQILQHYKEVYFPLCVKNDWF